MGFTMLPAIVLSLALLKVVLAGNNDKHSLKFPLTMLSRSCDHFGMKVYNALAQNDENVIFSPLSLLTALSMTYAAASLGTAGQLKQALQITLMQRKEILEGFMLLGLEMKRDQNINISHVNGIFAKKRHPFEETAVNEITESFEAQVIPLDVGKKTGPELEINNFVKNVSRGRIPELLPPDYVTPMGAFYLVNALYFQASWLHTFSKYSTRDLNFYVTPTITKQTKMMNLEHYFRCIYVKRLKFMMLELPFLGERYALYILLPDARNGLKKLRRRLRYPRLISLFNKFRYEYKMDVTLPKFNLSRTMDMKDVLKKLGVKKMFNKRRADFSRLDKTRRLYVDKVQQQAILKIDELGAEGAVASVSGSLLRSLPRDFIADHPFMFILRDKSVGVSLFMGQYTGPE